MSICIGKQKQINSQGMKCLMCHNANKSLNPHLLSLSIKGTGELESWMTSVFLWLKGFCMVLSFSYILDS